MIVEQKREKENLWIIHKVIEGKEYLEYYEDSIYDLAWGEFELLATFRFFTHYPKFAIWLEYKRDKTTL